MSCPITKESIKLVPSGTTIPVSVEVEWVALEHTDIWNVCEGHEIMEVLRLSPLLLQLGSCSDIFSHDQIVTIDAAQSATARIRSHITRLKTANAESRRTPEQDLWRRMQESQDMCFIL
ncbi:hypothetical protein BST61_g6599 [Cercospora zeina]